MRDEHAKADFGLLVVMIALIAMMVYSHDQLFVFKCAAILVALNLADISAEIARLRRACKEKLEEAA